MADGGFDPCECIWSHEQAMRRLISLLRSSQGYCTENECYRELPGPATGGGDSMFFLILMGWVLIAVVLYFLRPKSNRIRGDAKPVNNQGPGNPPPDNPLH